jgi:hypothetical protein
LKDWEPLINGITRSEKIRLVALPDFIVFCSYKDYTLQLPFLMELATLNQTVLTQFQNVGVYLTTIIFEVIFFSVVHLKTFEAVKLIRSLFVCRYS